MLSLLTDFQIDLIVAAVAFAAGLSPLGTKAKDYVKGVPAEVRAAVSSFETSAVASVNAAKTSALNDLKAALPGGLVAKPAAPAAPAPVAVQAAPAPAPAPVAPAAPVAQAAPAAPAQA